MVSSIRSLAGRAESTTSPISRSKCHDRDSNPHSADQTPEIESGALNRSAMICHENIKLCCKLVKLPKGPKVSIKINSELSDVSTLEKESATCRVKNVEKEFARVETSGH